MLTIEVCRNLLGFVSTHLTDTEVFALRDQFMEIAGVAIALYASGVTPRSKGPAGNASHELATLPDAERADVEERAAVIEFDAKLPRDVALRAALNQQRKNARRRRR